MSHSINHDIRARFGFARLFSFIESDRKYHSQFNINHIKKINKFLYTTYLLTYLLHMALIINNQLSLPIPNLKEKLISQFTVSTQNPSAGLLFNYSIVVLTHILLLDTSYNLSILKFISLPSTILFILTGSNI